jgi:putative phosphoesterase
MRVAALFDIHGNLPALEAVRAELDAERPDLVVCGGDAVPGPFPRETLSLLRDLGGALRYVHGNGERSVVQALGARRSDDPHEEQARWCATELTTDELEFLASLPLSVTVSIDGLGEVLFCHGTPRSDEEIVTLVTPDERLAAILEDVAAQVIVAGHTHTQLDRNVRGKRFVNPGSVGMPYEDEPGARWALLGPDVELRTTAYDREAAAARIRATAFPFADDFVTQYVLAQHSPDETAPFFEGLAAEGDHGAQAANSEK